MLVARAILLEPRDPSMSEPRSTDLRALLLALVQRPDGSTADDLAGALHYSASTVRRRLMDLETALEPYGLAVERQRFSGVRLTGPEPAWRRVMAEVMRDSSFPEEQARRASQPKESHTIRTARSQLDLLAPGFSSYHLEDLLLELESSFDITFTDESYTGLFIHLALCVLRNKQGQNLIGSESDASAPYKNMALWLRGELERRYDISIVDKETTWIALYLEGARLFGGEEVRSLPNLSGAGTHEHEQTAGIAEDRLHCSSESNLTKDSTDESAPVDAHLQSLARRAVSIMEAQFNLELERDQDLLRGLLLHLKPAMKRLSSGEQLSNPLLEEIQNTYAPIYYASREVAHYLNQRCGYVFGPDEVGYLAMHFGAALERQRHEVQGLLVSDRGRGETELIRTRLRNEFPSLSLDVAPLHRFASSSGAYEQAELVISTEEIDLKSARKSGRSVVRISPSLSGADIRSVRQELLTLLQRKLYVGEQGQEAGESEAELSDEELLYQMLREAPVLCRQGSDSPTDIIREMVYAISSGADAERLHDQVLEREALSPTAIQGGWAAPHVVDLGAQHMPRATVAILQDPLEWGELEVRVVVLMRLGKGSANLFRILWQMFDDPSWLSRLASSTDPEAARGWLLYRHGAFIVEGSTG